VIAAPDIDRIHQAMIRFATGQGQETKCGEIDGKESECPIVASKRGNEPYRTPGSEGGAALWTGRRNRAEDTEPHQRATPIRWIV
jgi:hypothetical protein